MVDVFININKVNMSVEEYSLKFSKMYKYAPSLLSNTRDEICRFETEVADLVREECRMVMIHDMTVARLMVYAQSIEEYQLKRIDRTLKRGGFSDHEKTRVKKRAQTQE